MFETFFGTINTGVVALDEQGRQVKLLKKIESDLHKDAITERDQLFTKDLQVSCSCTLDEFFVGSTKELKFDGIKLLGDGRSTEIE